MTDKWTTQNIPDMTGKVVIVTGANSGIGYVTAKALAAKGANVVMACRNLEKANAAAETIRAEVKDAKLDILRLDLADLSAVHAFAEKFKEKYNRLDLLINNAGIMIPPMTRTADGFEVQFGANHLGHFALTGLLLDIVRKTPNSRIINVSSSAHLMGRIDFDNLNAEKGYNRAEAYAQSKLANLLFTFELNRRFSANGSGVFATAAHPGWTVTGLQKGLIHVASELVAQKPGMGALPTLRAATDPDAHRGDYFGPGGLMGIRGYPKKVGSSKAAREADVAKHLWEVSEELTGVRYPQA